MGRRLVARRGPSIDHLRTALTERPESAWLSLSQALSRYRRRPLMKSRLVGGSMGILLSDGPLNAT
jgi:hypothetical protein